MCLSQFSTVPFDKRLNNLLTSDKKFKNDEFEALDAKDQALIKSLYFNGLASVVNCSEESIWSLLKSDQNKQHLRNHVGSYESSNEDIVWTLKVKSIQELNHVEHFEVTMAVKLFW